MSKKMSDLAIGDFVVTSWGYDQTNVSFYKVVGKTPSGKSLRLQQWGKVDVSTGDNPHESVIPGKSAAEHYRRDLDDNGNTVFVTVQAGVSTSRIVDNHVTVDGQYGMPWDGKPMYQTGHGYGH